MAKKPKSRSKSRPKPTTRPLRDRLSSQASDEALLRFNPERSTLRSALQDAGGQLKQEVDTARGTSAAVRQTARASRPVFRDVYGGAQQTAQQSAGDVLAATQGTMLGPGASREIEGVKARLGESLASALAETQARENEAQSGMAFAINNAQSRFGRNVDKIQSRLGELDREEGAYVSGRLGDLLGEDRKLRHDTNQQTRQQEFQAGQNRAGRSVTRRGQTLSHEDRVATREQAARNAAKDKSPSGVKWRTPEGQTAFKDSVRSAVEAVKPFAGKLTRGQAAKMFLSGVNAPQEVDEKKYRDLKAKNPTMTDGEAKRLATKPARKVAAIPETRLRVALDMVYDGHISPATRDVLHDAGIKVNQLGTTNRRAPRPGGVRRPPTPAQRRRQQAAGRQVAGLVPGFGR